MISQSTRQTLLLLPGILCDADLWRDNAAALADAADCRICDMPEDSIEAMAAGVLAAAPPRFALAGLSMGGYVALVVQRQAPGRVTRLFLANTSARPDSPKQSEGRRMFIAEAQSKGFDATVRRLLSVCTDESRRDDAALQTRVEAMLRRCGVDTFIRQQTATMARADSRPGLAAIKVPVQVITGEGDRIVPPDHTRELAAGIAGAQLTVLPGCGHLSSLEQPAAVNALLREWLAR